MGRRNGVVVLSGGGVCLSVCLSVSVCVDFVLLIT